MAVAGASGAAGTVADALLRFRDGVPQPAAAAAPAGAVSGGGRVRAGAATRVPFSRPNGEVYYGRSVPGAAHDVELLRRCVGVTPQDNLFVLLGGVPGTGKTAVCEAAFPDLVTVSGDEDTSVDDFYGSWVQFPDGVYRWVDGPLLVAAEGGLPFLIDEIAVISPRVLTAVYPAMDGRGVLRAKGNPSRAPVVIKPGFFVVGSWNPGAPGARVSDALLSRFSVHVEYSTDFDLAVSLGVDERFVAVARNIVTKNAGGERIWVPQMRELLDTRKAVERFGLQLAVSNFVGRAPLHDRAVVADLVSRKFGFAVGALVTGSSNIPLPPETDPAAAVAVGGVV